MPDVFRCLRCEYWCAYSTHFSAHGLRVHWAPGIPRALVVSRENDLASSGRCQRRGKRTHAHHCSHCAKRERPRASVIPGWSEGPDLRCAIAHRGIWRFRVRCYASPRNDGLNEVLCRARNDGMAPFPGQAILKGGIVADSDNRTSTRITCPFLTHFPPHPWLRRP